MAGDHMQRGTPAGTMSLEGHFKLYC